MLTHIILLLGRNDLFWELKIIHFIAVQTAVRCVPGRMRSGAINSFPRIIALKRSKNHPRGTRFSNRSTGAMKYSEKYISGIKTKPFGQTKCTRLRNYVIQTCARTERPRVTFNDLTITRVHVCLSSRTRRLCSKILMQNND